MGMDATGRRTGCGLGVPVSAWRCLGVSFALSALHAHVAARGARQVPNLGGDSWVACQRCALLCLVHGAFRAVPQLGVQDYHCLETKGSSATEISPLPLRTHQRGFPPGRCGDRALQGRLWQRGGSREPMPLHAPSSLPNRRPRNLKPQSSQRSGSGWLLLPNPRLPGVTGQFISLTF